MSLNLAAAQARMGQSVIARMANARLVPAGGVALPALFTRQPTDASFGEVGAQVRVVEARCLSADLPEHVVRGAECALYYDDQLHRRAGLYEVRQRDDNFETGISRLDLQLIER